MTNSPGTRTARGLRVSGTGHTARCTPGDETVGTRSAEAAGGAAQRRTAARGLQHPNRDIGPRAAHRGRRGGGTAAAAACPGHQETDRAGPTGILRPGRADPVRHQRPRHLGDHPGPHHARRGTDWDRTLDGVLDRVHTALGLPPTTVLRAEPHALLVYGKGQFFLPHQDSEKDDSMVGTLVVSLPSHHTGGELVVSHAGRSIVYQASREKLTFAAFYADCLHEVKPVKSGYRVTLTMNLLADLPCPPRHGVAAREGRTPPPPQPYRPGRSAHLPHHPAPGTPLRPGPDQDESRLHPRTGDPHPSRDRPGVATGQMAPVARLRVAVDIRR